MTFINDVTHNYLICNIPRMACKFSIDCGLRLTDNCIHDYHLSDGITYGDKYTYDYDGAHTYAMIIIIKSIRFNILFFIELND